MIWLSWKGEGSVHRTSCSAILLRIKNLERVPLHILVVRLPHIEYAPTLLKPLICLFLGKVEIEDLFRAAV